MPQPGLATAVAATAVAGLYQLGIILRAGRRQSPSPDGP
jgi:hypothetical protein